MLQQCELRVMRREKEGPSRVHFDSKILRVKWMNLRVKCAIKVADREVVMLHLPAHGISRFEFLDVSELPDGSTARCKKVSIFQVAVEVVDYQSDNSPFFVIKGGEECMDTCPHSFTSLGCPNDLALKWTNHVSSFIQGNFGMPYHAFDMNFAFDGGAGDNVRLSKRTIARRYPAVP